MTITLPLRTQLPPQWRIMRRRNWGQGNWDILPTNKLKGGFFVEEFWRSCIPEAGQATLRYDMGLIDGMNYGTDSAGTNESDEIDLIGHIVRIQCAPGFDPISNEDPPETPEWKTVWVGVVELQEDTIAPGATILLGSRHYHCMDLLAAFTKRQPMNRHGVYINATTFNNCYGHPGYNGSNWDGRILGNKEPSGVTWSGPWDNDSLGAQQASFNSKVTCFAHAGADPSANASWTDLQAVENALATSRIPNTPFFYMTGQTAILSNSNAWPVDEGMTAWDFIAGMFKRQRGRGVAFLDWDDDSSAPDGDLTVYIRLNPQTLADISYTPPGGALTSIPGASTASTTVTVDLVGDHRNMASTFTLGDRYQHVYNYVESLGERIEVLGTLDYNAHNLEKRWSTADETAYAASYASDTKKVLGARYDTVYQLHGLAQAWNGQLGNGNSSSSSASTSRGDYRCADDGTITIPSGQPDTSPILVEIMHDLPLYAGYNYAAATPVRYDGATETLAPNRRPPLVLIKQAADRYIQGDMLSFALRVYDTGMEVVNSADRVGGGRYFSGETSTTGGVKDKEKLIVTVGLQLPHRVRMASGDVNGARKKQLFHKGLHLWLAHPDAIWDLSETIVDSDGNKGKRNAGAASPGILRDDRAKLAREHALAQSWYLTQRRTASWQLKACGFLTGFYTADENGNPVDFVNYPTIGKMVTTLTAGPEIYTINTPITKVHFTNRMNGVTTWITDWSDLDLR